LVCPFKKPTPSFSFDEGQNQFVRTRVKPGWIVLLLFFSAAIWFLWMRQINEPEFQVGCAGSPTPAFATPRTLPKTLRDLRIMLNPGHGITLTDQETWGFQRPKANGISVFVLEDDSNVRLARSIKKVLEANGATVLSTRELEDTQIGKSGLPVWREASKHHLERLGVDKGIWDSRGFSLRSDCRLAKDIRTRPLYANDKKVDLLLSIHSNAGQPLARGTQVFYPTRHFLRATQEQIPEQSACLAKNLATAVPKAIRLERPDLRWGNGSVTGSNKYGENGFALMPSVILEVAFHTNALDGKALTQESFRQAVANGIKTAVTRFLEQPSC
jgi:N-acetylmuramoyl-L-alanine amidase